MRKHPEKRLKRETRVCVRVCVCAHITSATTAKSSCGRLLAGPGVRGHASEGIVPLKGYLGLSLVL